jgi:hypothetical protein
MKHCVIAKLLIVVTETTKMAHWKKAHKKVCKKAPSNPTRGSDNFIEDKMGTLQTRDIIFK